MFAEKPLFLITDGGELRSKNLLVETVSKALDGAKGAVYAVVLREQLVGQYSHSAASDEEVLNLAQSLHPVCLDYRAKLIIHGRVDLLAENSFFSGVHLNKFGPAIINVRREFGEESIIGFSAHDAQEAQDAFLSGADYVFISPVFPPISKEKTREALGVDGLKICIESSDGDVIALGGITSKNAKQCMQVGASGIAVIGSVLNAEDPGLAAKELAQSLIEL
jgi:thiamine-phosphate pyrophosphorylase